MVFPCKKNARFSRTSKRVKNGQKRVNHQEYNKYRSDMKRFLTWVVKTQNFTTFYSIHYFSRKYITPLVVICVFPMVAPIGCKNNNEEISHLYQIGRHYMLTQQLDSAAFYYSKAEDLLTRHTPPLLRGKVLFDQGLLVQRIFDYERSTLYFKKAFLMPTSGQTTKECRHMYYRK